MRGIDNDKESMILFIHINLILILILNNKLFSILIFPSVVYKLAVGYNDGLVKIHHISVPYMNIFEPN
jgi:hypothetical protein